jgi:hypothetical protein
MMIALTARYVFPAPQLRVALWPLMLLSVLLLPLAFALLPVALLLAPARAGKSELIERVKRGEMTLRDAIRELEARP